MRRKKPFVEREGNREMPCRVGARGLPPFTRSFLHFLSGSILVQGALLEFGKMIKSETGMSGYIFYGFYGCHCGLGGTGVPKDATDW